MIDNFYTTLLELQQKNIAFTIASVVKKQGHCPQIPGAKMIVTKDNDVFGTIGGGELELLAIQKINNILIELPHKKIISFTKEYILSEDNKDISEYQNDSCVQTNMMCGGKITIFYDIHYPKEYVYIFGGGHVGSSIWYHISKLDFNVKIIDSRVADDIIGIPEELLKVKDNVFICSDYNEKMLRDINFMSNAYFIIVTHSHETDFLVLKYLYDIGLKLEPKYIGVIASKSKSESILKRLVREDNNVNKEFISRIYCPIGLKIGGAAPSEIALSIISELQVIKYNKTVDCKVVHHTKDWINTLNLN